MDEMVIGKSRYVSTKRASRMTGYAQDYIGQLVRGGKLKATKVGKSWFILSDDILELSGKPSAVNSPDRALAVLESRKVQTESIVTFNVEYPKTWSSVQYFHENEPLLPISDNRDTTENKSSIEILDEHRLRIFRGTSGDRVGASSRPSLKSSTGDRSASHVGQTVTARSFDGVRYETHAASTAASRPSLDRLEVVDPTGLVELAETERPSSPFQTNFDLGWLLRTLVAAVLVSFVALLVPIF